MTCHECSAPPRARGLCDRCYVRARYQGRLDDYERTFRPRDETLSEWERLRLEGYTVPNAAHRLGMTTAALQRAIYRGRAAGDPRARKATA